MTCCIAGVLINTMFDHFHAFTFWTFLWNLTPYPEAF